MWKFITVSFFFLGLAFYELSGGNEFDAEALRLSRVDPAPEVTTTAAPTRLASAEKFTPATTIETTVRVTLDKPDLNEATVTRASFNLNAPTSTLTGVTPVSASDVSKLDRASEQTLILPSLIAGSAPDVQRPTADDTSPVLALDVRAVTGNRVNVRGGPGTDYGIVNRLTRGQEVEIISDPGNGWVKLRPVDGGTVGWMADFLLSES